MDGLREVLENQVTQLKIKTLLQVPRSVRIPAAGPSIYSSLVAGFV